MKLVSSATVFWVVRGVVALWLGLVALRAHDPGLSTADGSLRAETFELVNGFAPADAQLLLPAALRTERTWTAAEFEAAKTALQALAPQLWDVQGGGGAVAPREVRVELAAQDALNFTLVYPRPDGTKLTLRAMKLDTLPSVHRQFTTIVDERGSLLTQKFLRATDPSIEVRLVPAVFGATGATTAEETPLIENPTFLGFVTLGIEHIWMGYDHLLFLFALLLVCQSYRSIIGIITCFTVAHSLTLILATFDLVSLPGWLVEPAIAASIVFVGVENLWRRGAEPKGRWALTFCFGLIHGFGFAGVLRELGIGENGQGLALPLFSFNLGVELGQIVIAVVALPILWRLRQKEKFVRVGVPVLSAVVALAGLYWLLERTVLG